MDTGGSLVGCPRCAAFVVACSFFFTPFCDCASSVVILALFSHSRGSLLGDPFSGTSLGTQDSSEALSVSCPRNRFAEAFSCFLLLLRLPLVGACSFWRLHRTLLEGADPPSGGHTPGWSHPPLGRVRPRG